MGIFDDRQAGKGTVGASGVAPPSPTLASFKKAQWAVIGDPVSAQSPGCGTTATGPGFGIHANDVLVRALRSGALPEVVVIEKVESASGSAPLASRSKARRSQPTRSRSRAG